MASRFAAGLFGRSLTTTTARVQTGAVRRLATAAGENEFLAERMHHKEHAGKSADLWRKVSLYVCIPGSIVLAVYIYGIEKHHYDHMVHEFHDNDEQPPERTFYEYNNIRKKAFPWGDGSKSFFHNKMINYSVDP
ncbi:Cytochrome c oxidase, subunit VIa [Kalmanozyma brasiliensis GHG001]|uniref:Cytochrome c oxidase subunit n=1 Tax=Kalmanozyma brasiliensis (strain GHG001) TaxID=1365824 RepID=V5EM94_KALBG|nr:Cytochrome c oxidase, subunit VIa [Kalmanozyma brasiliensis GHG001]EST06255.1 Cytochrome c oxidase, subunit VIa [Kalmanozyma brasiliensis GHG001]